LLLVLEREGAPFDTVAESARRLLATEGSEPGEWTSPNGAAHGRGSAPGKLGFVFPGQGSQYVGMALDLACQFPAVLEALAEADRAFGEAGGRRLSDHLYPHPVFDDPEAAAAHEAALRDTSVAQPAIGAVSVGALRVLGTTFGVQPEAVAGHSYGELVALHAAGRLDVASLHDLSRLRGRLMGEADNGTGGMLAVQPERAHSGGAVRPQGGDPTGG
jgi:acyl transferase domain-containing protein